MKKIFGYTLIELLVVMSIIGILATVIVLSISPGKQYSRSRNIQRNSDIYLILSAIARYSLQHNGSIPVSITSEAITASSLSTDLIPSYLDSIPLDPKGGEYFVSVDGNYRVTVSAPDAELDTIIQVTK